MFRALPQSSSGDLHISTLLCQWQHPQTGSVGLRSEEVRIICIEPSQDQSEIGFAASSYSQLTPYDCNRLPHIVRSEKELDFMCCRAGVVTWSIESAGFWWSEMLTATSRNTKRLTKITDVWCVTPCGMVLGYSLWNRNRLLQDL